MVNLWIDDVRRPPEGWDWAKTSREAIQMLTETQYERVSFDHDLGPLSMQELLALTDDEAKHDYNLVDTTRPVVMYLCEMDSWPPVVYVHSANPVGVEWLEGMINRYGPGTTRQG